ncbi:MAG: hypothetical protein LBH43_20595 [Treponema sp.]|jgi:hypothetical protein|nr:hypothetical protein [Treponema sp.]
MGFRAVFAIINIFLIFISAVFIVTPVHLLGPDFASVFLQKNWVFILLPALFLVFYDLYFLKNWRFYALLEKEDWPALVHYLEELVIRKGKYRPRLVQVLANTYLVLSDSSSVMHLEKKLSVIRPSLVDKNAMVFGMARIIGRDIPGALQFFESRLLSADPGAGAGPDLRLWLRWYYGFTLLLNKRYEDGAGEFAVLARESKNSMVAGLSAYFLQGSAAQALPLRTAELRAVSNEARERITKAFPLIKDWLKETGKFNTEIHTAILVKQLEETGLWLYSKKHEKF